MEPKKITPRRAATRARLEEAAITVIARLGVSGSSIEEICETASLTRGAFYSNFGSKDELLLAICERGITEAITEVSALVATEDSFGHREREDEDPGDASAGFDLDTAVRQVFALQSRRVEWVLAERQIDVYTLLHPEVRRKYLELVEAQSEVLSRFIETTITALGGTLEVPAEKLLSLIIPVVKDAEETAVTHALAVGDPMIRPDPTDLLMLLRAFVSI